VKKNRAYVSYDKILVNVQRYYDAKVEAHGATARGADWNSAQSQQLRFRQLLKLCDQPGPFIINDYGCGYGALVGYLLEGGYAFSYLGFDISPQMIAKARELYPPKEQVTFVSDETLLREADYTVASGIFNVKLHTPQAEWEQLMLRTLDKMNGMSRRGFAFNVLTKYSDRELMRPDLYYADPLFLFDHCKATFSRFVALLHDYPLYEFTILVRKA
jgi:SAM-dependent methyltransferase